MIDYWCGTMDENSDTLSCEKCNKTFGSKGAWKYHTKNNVCANRDPMAKTCPKCMKVFGTKGGLRYHVSQNVCSDENRPRLVPIHCPKCGKQFETEGGLSYHVKNNVCERRAEERAKKEKEKEEEEKKLAEENEDNAKDDAINMVTEQALGQSSSSTTSHEQPRKKRKQQENSDFALTADEMEIFRQHREQQDIEKEQKGETGGDSEKKKTTIHSRRPPPDDSEFDSWDRIPYDYDDEEEEGGQQQKVLKVSETTTQLMQSVKVYMDESAEVRSFQSLVEEHLKLEAFWGEVGTAGNMGKKVNPLTCWKVPGNNHKHEMMLNAGLPVSCMEWSPERIGGTKAQLSKYLAIGTVCEKDSLDVMGALHPNLVDNVLQLWEFPTQTEKGTEPRLAYVIDLGKCGTVFDIAWCPNLIDGVETRIGLLAIATADGMVKILRMPIPEGDVTLVHKHTDCTVFAFPLQGKASGLSLAWNPQNNLMCGVSDGTVLVWFLRELSSYNDDPDISRKQYGDYPLCVTLRPSMQEAAFSNPKIAAKQAICKVDFSREDPNLVVGITTSNALILWDIRNACQPIMHVTLPNNLTSMCWPEESDYLLLGDECGFLWVMELERGFAIPLQSHQDCVRSIAVSRRRYRRAHLILTGGNDGHVMLWSIPRILFHYADARRQKNLRSIPRHTKKSDRKQAVLDAVGVKTLTNFRLCKDKNMEIIIPTIPYDLGTPKPPIPGDAAAELEPIPIFYIPSPKEIRIGELAWSLRRMAIATESGIVRVQEFEVNRDLA